MCLSIDVELPKPLYANLKVSGSNVLDPITGLQVYKLLFSKSGETVVAYSTLRWRPVERFVEAMLGVALVDEIDHDADLVIAVDNLINLNAVAKSQFGKLLTFSDAFAGTVITNKYNLKDEVFISEFREKPRPLKLQLHTAPTLLPEKIDEVYFLGYKAIATNPLPASAYFGTPYAIRVYKNSIVCEPELTEQTVELNKTHYPWFRPLGAHVAKDLVTAIKIGSIRPEALVVPVLVQEDDVQLVGRTDFVVKRFELPKPNAPFVKSDYLRNNLKLMWKRVTEA